MSQDIATHAIAFLTLSYAPTGLKFYVVMRSSPTGGAVPITVADTAAGAKASLEEAKKKNER
jgi:hypothetical protein